ncbi:tRNA pseudouridine(54/55) synthase Pus10 [Candidatus Acetothermia bacterium]|nr:MAG: tRNA pseudouridine(54/55) synthase Pus10 [Candidatus Acetothermia bacterium]
MEPLELARRLITSGPICDHCLGTRFAGLGHGLSAAARGRLLRAALEGGRVEPSSCWVCGGLFERVPEWSARAVELARPYEHRTFLFGVHESPRLSATQEFLDRRFPSPWAEPVRRELNRELGRHYERLLGREVEVDFRQPELRFTVDLETGEIELHVASAYFYGRYRKLVRGIPQTHWPCRACRGRGCEKCGFTGKQYPTSVEELILPAFLEACGGEGGHLHGAGREDVDARMLGRGRPFVVEVEAPRRRTVDLLAIADRVNREAGGKVEVLDLRPATAELVERVKDLKARKRYRARVAFDRPVTQEELERALAGLVGEIAQRTPARVAHRRADLVRHRRVHEATGQLLSPQEAELEILCDGGLYVKELVSGDQGRTQPSLAGLLGAPARVTELDVLEVLDELATEDTENPKL